MEISKCWNDNSNTKNIRTTQIKFNVNVARKSKKERNRNREYLSTQFSPEEAVIV
jgi:hypothetical protein